MNVIKTTRPNYRRHPSHSFPVSLPSLFGSALLLHFEYLVGRAIVRLVAFNEAHNFQCQPNAFDIF